MGSRRGSILIISFWILLVLSSLVVVLAFRGGMQASMARSYYEQTRMRMLMRSAVYVGALVIESDQEPLTDHADEAWALDIDTAALTGREEFQPVMISICDEESKLNINLASQEMIQAVLERIKDESSHTYDHEKAAEAIMAYRGVGAMNQPGSTLSDGRLFLAFEELGFLKETVTLLSSEHRAVFTTFPSDGACKININTASETVVRGILAGVVGDEGVKQEFLDAIIAYRESVDDEGSVRYFSKNTLSAYKCIDAIGLSRDVKLVSIAVQFLRYVTVNSQYFTITASSVDVPGQIAALFGPDADVMRGGLVTGAETNALSVLSWREF